MRRLGLIFLIFLLSIATVNCVEHSLLATVTINPIYRLSLDIQVITERVLAGDNITVSVELNKTNLTEIEEEITVDLTYEILRPNKDLVASGDVGVINVKDHIETTTQIPTPMDARPGKYILKMNATNPQAYSASDGDDFWIRKIILFGLKPPDTVSWDFWMNITRFFKELF